VTRQEPETVDLRDIGAALRHGTAWIAAGAAAGLLLGLLLTWVISPRYEAAATILLRGDQKSAMGALAGVASGLPLAGLSGVVDGGSFDTEIEILTSRSVIGVVVDSLALQAVVLEPRGVSARHLFAEARFPREVEGRMEYRFVRAGAEYRVEGPGAPKTVVPGVPFRLGGGEATLRRGGLPDEFRVALSSREAAISQVDRALSPSKAGGDVAELRFDAGDPETAAAVPNVLIATYMERRRTTDRGVNQHRYEFLTAHTDSISRALATAEQRLRSFQEQSGVLDPELSGKTGVEQAVRIRAELGNLEVESRALGEIAKGRVPSTRQLAAYPSLLQNPAINGILERLLDQQQKRTELLDRRTPDNPDVRVLDENIRHLEGELVTLSRAYVDGLERKEAELRGELARYQSSLSVLPGQSEQILRLQREVRRLSETMVGLQTQLVQTRLAAIGEGGEVHPLDRAVVPRKPSWPVPLLNLGGGLLGGIFLGAAGAVAAAQARPRVREPWEAEVAAGVPAVRLDRNAPLLLGGTEDGRTVLIVPVGAGASPGEVAGRLASTAALQGRRVVLADAWTVQEGSRPALAAGAAAERGAHGTAVVSLPEPPVEGGYVVWRANGDRSPAAIRAALADLEERFELVIAAVGGLDTPVTVALLSPPRRVVLAGRTAVVSKTQLRDSVGMLARMGVETAGVVLEEAPSRRAARG
jgi:uncharacterized protein involved in exopolysaccharide biosynthesis